MREGRAKVNECLRKNVPMRRKYDNPVRNQWVTPVRTDYRLACCDCGLVHEVDFRVRSGEIQIRFRRNNRSTENIRRSLRRTVKS